MDSALSEVRVDRKINFLPFSSIDTINLTRCVCQYSTTSCSSVCCLRPYNSTSTFRNKALHAKNSRSTTFLPYFFGRPRPRWRTWGAGSKATVFIRARATR